ncbi:MAG: tyrosine-type recombinase/integrase [Rhodobacteraceae bacterium]|nr:tyrosine-type recombinase/integrase [Paracoccaceae bacterium]
MATISIDFTKPAKLLKAGPGMYRHTNERFPGLYLNVGKLRSTWYHKGRVAGKVRSIKLGAFPAMTVHDAFKHAEVKSDHTERNAEISTVRAGWEFHCETRQALGSMSDAHRIDMTKKVERYAPNILDMHPADVTSAQIQRVINDLASEGKNATARHVRAALSSAFNYAGVINPVSNKRVSAPKSAEKETKLAVAAATNEFDADDWSMIWGAIMKQRKTNVLRGTAWIVMLFTGIRSGDVRSLLWDDINLQDKTIYLRKMKNKLARTIPICDAAVDALKAIRSHGSEFVFPAASKTGYLDHLTVLTAEIESKAVPVITQHDCRRHFMQASAEALLPSYVAHFLRGDVKGEKGDDMLMKYLKRMGNRRAVEDIEKVIVERIKVTPCFVD